MLLQVSVVSALLYAVSSTPIHADNQGAGKELWMSRSTDVLPVSTNSAHARDAYERPLQPPSGVNLANGKEHKKIGIDDYDAQVDNGVNRFAPGYIASLRKNQARITMLDPTQKSPLDSGGEPVFKQTAHPYAPNTNLINTSLIDSPLQTNRWWQNLIVESGVDPIHPYPYMVKCLGNSSIVGFPKFQATESAMTSSQPPDWEISDNSNRLSKRIVSGSDDLGVEVTWQGSSNSQMRSKFYKGMPFVTYEMSSIAPSLKTIHAIIKVEEISRTVNSNVQTTNTTVLKLLGQMADLSSLTQVTLNDNSKWLVVANPRLSWQQNNGKLTPQGTNGDYTGVIQVAHLGDNTEGNLNVLQQFAGVFPTSGSVSYANIQGGNQGRAANIVFSYKTNVEGRPLVSFLLPHHLDTLSKATVNQQPLSGYRATKGPLTAFAGNTITYVQPLESVSFEGTGAMSSDDRNKIQQQLVKDINEQTNVTAPDPYFFGKGVAKIARLYQIAQEINDLGSASKLRDKLVAYLKPWLVDKSNSDPFVYDKSWGGIVSAKGLGDPGADFGQGRYNDHHFHYGYFIYAGAVLAKHDVTVFQQFKEPLSQLLRDYANPVYQDKYFPYMRHFDPYDGHSWAAGLFTFGDGRNQESTGEAINAYYASYLYAKALGYEDLATFYEIILNMEATSGRRYWHPTLAQAKEQYLQPFTHNAVGIMWSSKADYATFFGAEAEFIYGIQMIPFTPATNLLVKHDWVKEAWCPDNSSCKGGMKLAAEHAGTNGWAQFLYTAYSLVDKNTALSNVGKCTPDDGNTLTNVLHWIATAGPSPACV
ncbi:hypothetical protein GGI12_004199 [Dipsacomyces acuminosporus]|nr:hypothetical protein GGI12_004199 [Dipsacomyces acuminosporus]